MKCLSCQSKQIVKKGIRRLKQRFQCLNCKRNFQNSYSYKRFDKKDDKKLLELNAEGLGIRSIGRLLRYSPQTICRRMLHLYAKVTKPRYQQHNQIYEVDELCTFVRKNSPENYCWITYALNRKTKEVIDVVVGSRNKKNHVSHFCARGSLRYLVI